MRAPTLPCPAELWPEFSRLLDEALELPDDAARAALLRALPADAAVLRECLARVIDPAAARAATAFLEGPPPIPELAPSGPGAGSIVGPWRLLRELGSGGMGTVWLAARNDGAYEREVALKLPHAHLLGGHLRGRFDRERDILAALNHPHVARFYDAGVAADGQPYLALEYVAGEAITAWCRSRSASLPARLDLMQQVLDAVQAAHARLIVHRDLKPSNVLVSAAGAVKLLDFGIAKLLDGDATGAATEMTRLGGRAVTPDYAAPEQLAGEPVTVATDVHALGGMLFELLTGSRPFAQAGRSRLAQLAGPAEGAAEAPLASLRIAPGHAQGVAGSSDRALRRALQGDLDAILARALAADPAERYASVEALAADLQRHRRLEPIQARHIGRIDRARRFARRHWRALSAGGALALAITAGVAGVLWQSAQAQAQARRAEATKAFLVGIFGATDPRIASDKPRGQVTARQLLDLGAERIDREFVHDPEVRIELLRTVAELYRELGEEARYEELQGRQVALSREHFGPLHDNVVVGAVEAAERACLRADWIACEALQTEADRLLVAARRDDSSHRAYWWLNEGIRLRAVPEAAARSRRAFETALRLFQLHTPDERGHPTALIELGNSYQVGQEWPDAIATYQEAIRVATALPGRNDAELQTTWANLGLVYQQTGDFLRAGEAFSKAAEIAERTTGADFRTAWLPRAKAARTLHLAGDRAGANQQFERLMGLLPPPEQHDRDAWDVRQDYGERLAAEGRPELAIPLLEGLERERLLGANHEFQLRLARRYLGDAYARAGRAAEARRALSAALADYLANDSPASQPTLAAHERWARFLLDQGETDAAHAQFLEVVAQAGERTWCHAALAHGGLARVALHRGDLPAALAASARALEVWSRLTGFRDARMEPYLWRIRADALAANGDLAQAQALEDRAATASAQYDHPSSPTVIRRTLAPGLPAAPMSALSDPPR